MRKTAAGLGIALALALASCTATGGKPTPTAQPGATNSPPIPGYVVALGRDGNPVGYVRQADVDPASNPVDSLGRPMAATIPVYAADLVTIVGHMVPDRGFVPRGTDPQSVPTLEAVVSGSPSGPPARDIR